MTTKKSANGPVTKKANKLKNKTSTFSVPPKAFLSRFNLKKNL